MTKTGTTADRRAVKSLPALRTSLRWYKREVLRSLSERASAVGSPKLRAFYLQRAANIRAASPTALRSSYIAERVTEIRSAGLFELARVTRNPLVRVSATLDARGAR